MSEVSKDLASLGAKFTTSLARQADIAEYVPKRGTKKLRLKPVTRRAAPVLRKVGNSTLRPINPREPSSVHALIVKTFIPGKGYVRAMDLVDNAVKGSPSRNRELRRAVHHQATRKKRVKREEQGHFERYKEHAQGQREMLDVIAQGGKQLPSPQPGTVFQQPSRLVGYGMKTQGLDAFAVKLGGRKNGQAVMVVPRGSTKETIDHELAHLTPKRSGYRLWEILDSPAKTMREEGRADMATRRAASYHASGTKKVDSGYVAAARDERRRELMQMMQGPERGKLFDKEPVEEYRRVQDKIYRARGGDDRQFRGNQYMDDKKRRRVLTAIAGGTAASGGYGVYRYKNRRTVKKNVDFLDMPNGTGEESSPEELETEDGSRVRAENLSSLRLRDVKTGKFVAGAGLVTKRGETLERSRKAGEGYFEWRKNKKRLKKLEDDMSVTIRRVTS